MSHTTVSWTSISANRSTSTQSSCTDNRATLSGVAKVTWQLRKFRWNVGFQEKSFKLEMENSIFVETRNRDGWNLCFIEYLFVWHAELVLYSLVSIDKAGKFLPSFNNLSRICLPNMLGFINLNNSMDFITLPESLEGFPRPPWLKGEYVPYAYVW